MGGMGGVGGMYGGAMGGMPGNPNDPNSLTNSFNQSTQATFQIIESIVGAFGGFAQMLESTYMATHSSFFGTALRLCPRSQARCLLSLSDGLGSRAIRQPSQHPRFRPRHLHSPPLAPNHPRQADRTPTPSRRKLPHPLRFRILHVRQQQQRRRRPDHPPRRHPRPTSPLQKTIYNVPPRRFRPPLPHGQAHPISSPLPRSRRGAAPARNVR